MHFIHQLMLQQCKDQIEAKLGCEIEIPGTAPTSYEVPICGDCTLTVTTPADTGPFTVAFDDG